MSEQEKIQKLLKAFYSHQDQFRGYVFASTRNYHATEEILQDIAILVVEKADQLDLERPMMPWLMGVARNKIKQWHQAKGNDLRKVNFDVLEACISHAQFFESEQVSPRQTALQQCLSRLPAKQKTIMELRYISREECSNIATITGRTVQSIYSLLKRIKVELRKCVEVQVTNQEAL